MRVQLTGTVPADIELALRQEGQKRELMREAHEWLVQTGTVREDGHYRFGTGKDEVHGRVRVDARKLFRLPFVRKWFIPALAKSITSSILDQVEVVAAPPTLGTLIGSDMTDYLMTTREFQSSVVTAFLSRDWDQVYSVHPSDEKMIKGRKVLLVDDVRHRNLTFVACHTAIRSVGGVVIATAELVDRNEATAPLPVPNFFVSQLERDVLYVPSECPMCRSHDPKVSAFTEL
jgi:orotate phosphoribosyltransferase